MKIIVTIAILSIRSTFTENIAATRPDSAASQNPDLSSPGFEAFKAIDGSSSQLTNDSPFHCQHTDATDEPWWQLDLG